MGYVDVNKNKVFAILCGCHHHCHHTITSSGFSFSFAITGDVKAIEHFYKKSYVQKPLTTVEENAFLDLKLLAKKVPSSF